MIRVGVIGLGFMGNMHSKCYQRTEGAQLVAICDIDEKKLAGESGTAGNIEGAEEPLDMTGVSLYSDSDKMLAETNLDAVSITLPTYLHCEYTLKALKAGVNVLCEKPMALTVEECEKMITAAKSAGKILQIGQCMRFWPEYVKAKEIIDSGKYGKVKIATFQRLSLTPTWSWDNWILDGKRSGGAALDLHIHDSDFVPYLLGMPKAVSSQGINGPSGDFGHIVTSYVYDDKVVTAEGGWVMAPGFGFEMSFNIVLEKATIVFDITREPTFKVCPAEGEVFTPELAKGDGYSIEIVHFIKAVSGEKMPDVVTPSQAAESVKLVLLEKESARKNKKVAIK